MADRFTVAKSMDPNETIILDRGVPNIKCTNLITHADYAEIVARGLNALDRAGILPASMEDDEEDDTVLVPDAEQQATRVAGKVAGYRPMGGNL